MRRIACFTLIVMMLLVNCDDDHEELQIETVRLTGRFQHVETLSETQLWRTFELLQSGSRIEGSFIVSELLNAPLWSETYRVTGTMLTETTADLTLTLFSVFPSDRQTTNTVTLGVSVNETDVLHVNDWNIDIPRIN